MSRPAGHAAVVMPTTHRARKRKAAVDLWHTRCECRWETFTLTLGEADRRLAAHRASAAA